MERSVLLIIVQYVKKQQGISVQINQIKLQTPDTPDKSKPKRLIFNRRGFCLQKIGKGLPHRCRLAQQSAKIAPSSSIDNFISRTQKRELVGMLIKIAEEADAFDILAEEVRMRTNEVPVTTAINIDENVLASIKVSN